MTSKILIVDDEPNVLAALERLFRKDYSVETALGGPQALQKIAESGPFAVVLSDMRMPRMNGAELLGRVKEIAPDAIRMVLTGETDITAAIKAVNEGAIFRFLLKPCNEPTLRTAIDAALQQYRLQQAERFLLEKTLGGSVKVLTEVLSLVNPVAFGRSLRVQRYVRHLIEKLRIRENSWQFEIAAMLSHIGCVAIPVRTLEAVSAGTPVSDADRQQYLMHASVAHDLLAQIPRLEAVARMICRQHDPVSSDIDSDQVFLGGQILRVTITFDELLTRGHTVERAIQTLRDQPTQFSPRLVSALAGLHFDSVQQETIELPLAELKVGMVLDRDVEAKTGTVLATHGQEVTFPLLVRLRNYHQHGGLDEPVAIRQRRPNIVLSPTVTARAS